ncbi:ATP-dependent Clp protease ATP-binding subunit, partial [Candidatus Microgenomates bacterium]|nr:ATP-dependent Clp protease ATP-binding subunit [Candidatus Microgenomates bacterium]
MTHLTQRSNRVFMLGSGKAKELHNSFVDSEHVLYGLLSDSEIYKVLTDLKIQPSVVEAELNKVYKKENATSNPQLSPRVKRIIDLSLVVARQMGFEFISPEHILVSLVEEGEGLGAQVLKKLGLKKEDLNKKVTGKKGKLGEEAKSDHKSALAEFTINLTEKAQKGLLDPVVERSEVIERVIHILSRRTKNNPALTGEAGVGKTAVVEGLAQAIVTRKVPESLFNKQILELDLMAMLAGASHRGEFEERMKNLIEEVKNSNNTIILFIDEIHNIVGAGGGGDGAMDASNFLKPALARGELQLIGATTLTEYRKYIEKDPALERRFQPVLVPEPTEEAAIKMLKAIKGKYEAFHRVKITDEAIEAAVKLSKRYVGDRFLPDKGVDLIDEAASAVRLPMISLPEEIMSLEERIKQLQQEKVEVGKAEDKVHERILGSKIEEIQEQLRIKQQEYEIKKGQTTTEVKPEIIKDIVGRWTGIPVSRISESEVAKLAHLEDIIHERMIDQEEAVGVVSQAIRRGRAGLKSTHRPIGSFIFLGPTGVGKTELAKTVAEILFGQEEAMIRLDMTEFMEKHEVAKLLGAPPGYVGYEEGGKLTEAVRRKPYSVVLFDEIEKAHPDIFNIMLQILDDGRLTDNKGHVISFKNTVVICTSNIGSKTIQQEMINNKKADQDNNKEFFKAIKEKVMAELLKFFRPELVNRFDEVTVFEPLSFKDVLKVVKLQLKALVKLLEEQDMGMVYSDAALEEIARVGYDPVFGARPLQRTIQKVIENPISTLIIKGDMKAGDAVKIDFNGTDFVFDVGRGQLFEEDAMKKLYLCETTNRTFKTILVPNSTVVSPYCGSTKVKPLYDAEAEKKEAEKKAADAGKPTDAKPDDKKDP